jgi:hypothetical protein
MCVRHPRGEFRHSLFGSSERFQPLRCVLVPTPVRLKREEEKTNKTNVVCASMCVFCLSLLERKKAHIFFCFGCPTRSFVLLRCPATASLLFALPSSTHGGSCRGHYTHTHTNNDGRQPAAAARLLHLLHPVKGILSLEADQISFHSILFSSF